MINTLPSSVRKIVNGLNYSIDNVGRSSDIVINFDNKYILKISDKKDHLLKEKNINDWLINKVPCSNNIIFEEYNNKYYYLRTCLDGDSLINERFINNPELLIEILVKVIKTLRSLDEYECHYYSSDNKGNNFVHGDLCLPNIYVSKNNEFIGFIDLGNSGKGDSWYDYSWLLWSLEYNLGTDKYNKILLDKLKINYDSEKFNLYIPKEYQHTAYNIEVIDGYLNKEDVKI